MSAKLDGFVTEGIFVGLRSMLRRVRSRRRRSGLERSLRDARRVIVRQCWRGWFDVGESLLLKAAAMRRASDGSLGVPDGGERADALLEMEVPG